MATHPSEDLSLLGDSPAGSDLRRSVEQVGNRLAESLTALLGSLPVRAKGPQALGEHLGITTVTASRLLRAIGVTDPVAVVQQIPGVVPLRRIVTATVEQGAATERAQAAGDAITAFEDLIRDNAGHRSSLNAMLSDWLPQSRREFEIRRRQAAYKAISELKGVSCELDLATIVLHPSQEEGRVDLLSIQGTFGLDRIRPDSTVHLGTLRRTKAHRAKQQLQKPDGPARGPRTLAGDLAVDGLHSVRLDQFCSASPAPLETQVIGDDVQYTLGATGFGPRSSVDLVIAEVNPGELENQFDRTERTAPYFFQIPATSSRMMVFDLLIHEEVYKGYEPELMVYDIGHRGPAAAGSPEREIDRVSVTETLEALGTEPARRRFAGFPSYLELLDHSFNKLGWDPSRFRTYRVQMSYPLHGMQVSMALRLKG